MFGCIEREMAPINVIYLLAKKYLYQCRCRNQFPTLQYFKKHLECHLQTEKDIYVSKNKYASYLERWGNMAK